MISMNKELLCLAVEDLKKNGLDRAEARKRARLMIKLYKKQTGEKV
jgi:hypothetical protein